MSMRSGFFNSVNNDRLYDAGFFAEYFATFIGNGVFPNPSSNLQVFANDDMSVTIGKGAAWINGYVFFNDTDYNFDVKVADGVLSRMDRVVVRFDTELREITLAIKEGTPSNDPAIPELQRDADRYELALADISIAAGAISIKQEDVTDLRLNKELCGIVHGVVEQADTTAIFNQFENWYNNTKTAYNEDFATWTQEKKDAFNTWYTANTNEFENRFNDWFINNTNLWDDDFNEWFNSVKGQLEGDIATALASRVTTLEDEKASKAEVEEGLANKVDKVEGKGLSTNDYSGEEKSKLAAVVSDLATHEHNIVAQDGRHGIRYWQEKLEIYVAGEWIEFKSGSQYPVGNTKNFEANGDNNVIKLTWGDPVDRTITDDYGETLAIAKWKGTKILRKRGSYPQNENDGVLVVDNGVRNQYATNPFTDTGLINDVDYYYMAFPYTEDDIFTVDSANRVIGMPSDMDDYTNSVGPKKLIAGDMQAGYFGVVPASDLYTGAEISTATGITNGSLQFSDVGWLKFAIDGKIIYKSQKTYRNNLSWDNINARGCVDGTKQVTKNGATFKVRLMKGALTDPSNSSASDRGAKGSEWNRLMLPIHVNAKSKNWAYPAYVESDVPYWGIDFTDADLQTHYNHGDGSRHWCQETTESASLRVFRGYGGVSDSFWATSSSAYAGSGWSPVLEVVS